MDTVKIPRKAKVPVVTTHTYSNRDTIDEDERVAPVKPAPIVTQESLDKIKHPAIREQERAIHTQYVAEKELEVSKQVKLVRYALATVLGSIALFTLLKYGRHLFSSFFWGTKSLTQNAL